MRDSEKSYSSPDWTESDFRAFAGLIPDAVFVLNSQGGIVYVNERLERLFCYPNPELLGRKLEFLIPTYSDQHPEQPVLFVSATGRGLRGQRKDGTQFPVEISLGPAQTSRGTVVLGTVRDVSGRAAEAAWFRALLEATPDPIVIVDQHGTITLVNAQTEKMFGYTAAELIGQAIEILVPGRDREAHRRNRAIYAQNPRVRPMGSGLELFGRRKDGAEFPLEISLSPLQTAKGTFVVSAVRDISARKQTELHTRQLNRELEQALHRSEKLAAIGRLVATIAHEINNPLEALTNVLHLLESEPDLSAQARTLVQIAEQEVSRLDNLSRLTLAPHRESKFPETTRVSELLDDIVMLFQSKLQAAHITVERDYRSQAEVKLFPSELRQVFTNLIANAVDAMEANGGKLTLSVDRNGDGEVVAKVADTGCGIPAENLDLIFEPFFTTKGEEGTGVGLWVIANIVEKTGGHIDVTSSISGNTGTCFTIRFPAALAQAEAQSSAGEPALVRSSGDVRLRSLAAEAGAPIQNSKSDEARALASAQRARVLFVDDEAAMRETLPAILTMHNFEVTSVGSVDEALAEISRNRFDVLISDLNIGQAADGLGVVEAMRKAQPACVTVILTGYPCFETALRAIRHHVDHYLIKPTRPPELISAIQETLARADRPNDENRIALLLEEHAPEIARQTLKSLKADSRLAELSLTDAERIGYIPEVLRQVVERLSYPAGSVPPPQSAGLLIGETRKRQGYQVQWLWNDLKHLQRAIYHSIRPQVAAFDPTHRAPDLMLLNETLTSIFESAVWVFEDPASTSSG